MDGKRILLKNGFIADGSGEKGFIGSVVLNGEKIEEVVQGTIEEGAGIFQEEIDCSGFVIAPGFIDIHSHLDWMLTNPGKEEFKVPFIKQGITTVVGGNCGYSMAGIKRNSPYMRQVQDNLFKAVHDGIHWWSMEEYFSYLNKVGLSHNLVMLAGHGTTRVSVSGKRPVITQAEKDEINSLLEASLEEGAAGVSFGLQYEPGQYTNVEEIKKIAELVKSRGKVLTAHTRAYSKLSGDYPLVPFGKEHNLKAIEEIIHIARHTGVKLQLSHLIFVGRSTHGSCEKALSTIDKAISEGVDISFDTYGLHCGVSVINVFLPPWFKSRGTEACNNRGLLRRLKLMMSSIFFLLGFDYSSIQILDAKAEKLNCYNGMFLSEISKKRGITDFENYIDFIRQSNGGATVLMHSYTSRRNLEELIKHKASIFMTDAWYEISGYQNPAVFGSIPRLLQIVRENKLITMEEAVRKLTGAPAQKVGIKERGRIKKGYYGDITVFDAENIAFNTTTACIEADPKGIEHVFINGIQVLKDGKTKKYSTPGKVLRVL
jgi:N-acyl-D-amino-acid deacylase